MLGLLLMLLLYSGFCILALIVNSVGYLSLSFGVGSSFAVTCDSSSLLFRFTLTRVSISVLVWSYYYLDGELLYRRFFCLVLSFLASIIMLVFSSDLLRLFVAWDLLGFTSLFLVIFYRTRSSIAGGLLTGLSNRVGDCLFLASLGCLLFSYGNISFLGLLLLFIVSFTKSAMVPFSS